MKKKELTNRNCTYCIECIDCTKCLSSKHCDGCVSCNRCVGCISCYKCRDLIYCHNCFDCFDCTDCRGCRGCRGCVVCAGISGFRSNPQRITSPKLGSRNEQTTVYWNEDKVQVVCGCFTGTLEEFKQRVKEKHKDNSYARAYLKWIEMVENTIKFVEKNI